MICIPNLLLFAAVAVDVTGEVQSRTATTTVPVQDAVAVGAPGIATTSLRSIITLLRTPMMMLQRSSTGRTMMRVHA